MTPARRRRLYMVLGIIGGVAVATGFALKAMQNSIGARTPTDVVAGMVKPGKRFQLEGMVQAGSVQRTPGSLELRFIVEDCEKELPVVYSGVLPDLFKEKSGVQANGRLNEQGVFVADEVLAKHDENYMPPAMGEALKKGQSRLESPPTGNPPPVGKAPPTLCSQPQGK
jgi:cytochrome c-type biogenesis protein CcmE